MTDGTTPLSPRPGAHPPARAPRRSFRAALGWTVLGALVPGTGLLAAGRRRLGAAVLTVFLLLVAGGVWLATAGRRFAARTLVDTDVLLWTTVGVGVLALLWIAVVVVGYRMLVPPGTSRGRHVAGGLVVAVLVAAVAVPSVLAGHLATTSRDLIAGVFDDDRQSATVDEEGEDTAELFGGRERVNVLLLGGDGGEGREGVRTDTVIVASTDVETGDTVLFSLPRNLQDLPFPEDSPLGEVYPDGFDAGSESESLLNAVYRNGPAWYPDVLGPTDDPGADFLKLGVGEALGLRIDYFVLVNLEGFSRLVDALGGVTVDVNYYVPINGDPGTGELPDDYIAPGRDVRMDGFTALQFARGRFGLTDYDRMARQRCTISAIVDAADPVTLLQRYQRLAATTEDIVSTDIPRTRLDDFVDLAFRVKDAEIRSVVLDTSVIDPAYPDYDRIRELVDEAIDPRTPVPAAGTQPSGDGAEVTEAPEPSEGPVTDVVDACAYDPVRAAEARAAGEPPSKQG
ncbi:cell envelope-related function transcriptional attenuator common domain-containing protein [Blastococcus sp. DSM 46786]|uniref:LCP family protein n=1 Tax=Blastococcus sp. DSM 46786 TaxID=1798227 RepID=UPI0008B00296|nr:LCP family protein [Blastococcus sp. DSM 46786]SEM06013.1 cell envelope-related function transcriptional attenuator common domain-containing protein [Blastococcus sp. DSM 46786]